MTVIHRTESFNELWANPPAAGWCAYYPGTLGEPEVIEEREAALSRRPGVLRIAGVFLVICALLAYLVVPVTTFTLTHVGGGQPSRIQPIPVAPEHKSVRLRV